MSKRMYGLLLFIVTLFFTINTLADSPRKGLVEEATNTSCAPCAYRNPSFQQWIFNNLDVLVPVVYHAWWPGANDPFYTENTVLMRARIKDYYGIDKIGVPYGLLNGSKIIVGNHPASFLSSIRSSTSPLTITIKEKRNGNSDEVTVTVNSSQAISGKKLRIQVLEYFIRYNAPNKEKEFYWIARKMLPDHNGIDFSIGAGETKEFKQTFNLKSTWKKNQIYIAAFIQDDEDKNVLQAEHNLKVVVPYLFVDKMYLAIDASSSLSKDIEVKNTNSKSIKVKLSIDTKNSFIPSGWKAQLSTPSITIPAKSTKKVQLKVNSNDDAGFSIVHIAAEPVTSNPLKHKTNTNIGVLSNETKYAFFIGINDNAGLALRAIAGNLKYGSKMAAIPMSKDILKSYPMNEKFDLVVLSYDFWHRDYLTYTRTGYSSSLARSLKSMVTAGKKILITGEHNLQSSTKNTTDPEAKSFLTQTLGIGYANNSVLRVRLNSQNKITGIIKFNAKGISGDPIGNGINLTLNDYTHGNDPFIILTDIIKILNPKAKPFLYYDNDKTKTGGVRIENGESKAVFLTFGFEAIKNTTQRNQFMGKILDWLFSSGSSTVGPQIKFSSTKLAFGEVKINKTDEQTLTLSNTGDKDLTIKEISMDSDYDPDGVFTFKSGNTTPITIAPGSSHNVVVSFSPKKAKQYDGMITIKSNSTENSENIVDIKGKGLSTQGPIIASRKKVLDFGRVEKNGKGKIGDVVILNEGTEDIIISKIKFENNDDNVFTFVTGNEATKIEPGKDITITVKFKPTSAKLYTADVVVESNATNHSKFTVRVDGQGFTTGVPEEVTSIDGAITLKATPNPMGAKGIITYTLNTNNTGSFEMYLVDLNGRVVRNFLSGSVSSGTHTLDFDTSSLSSGTYVIIAQHNGSIAKMPMIITK